MSAAQKEHTAELPRKLSDLHQRLITTGNLLAAAARGQVGANHGLADIWDSTLEAMRDELIEQQKLTQLNATTTRIGECELCGVVDHHLITALCSVCLPKIEPYKPKE